MNSVLRQLPLLLLAPLLVQTLQRCLAQPAGARPGMVVYTTYQTAYVDPDGALAQRLRVN